MVKLRHIQATHPKKEDEGRSRTLLSFSNFRRSFTAPGGICRSRIGRIPGSEEIANACAGLNTISKAQLEGEPDRNSSEKCSHANSNPLQGNSLVRLGLTRPDANTNLQVSWVLNEISNSTKQAEPTPASQLAAAFNRWRYSHLKVEQRLHMELLRALNRAETAECVVAERDTEIKKLRDELRKVEEENCQITAKLQADIALLQNMNECSRHEVKDLIEQLAGIRGEAPPQAKKRSKFDSYLGKPRKKHSKDIKERVNFVNERDANKIDFSLEEVGMAWQCRNKGKPKALQAVSMELDQHLRKLTSYVRNLEACIQQGGQNGLFERRIHTRQQTTVHNSNFVEPVNPVTFCLESNNSVQAAKAHESSQNRSYSAAGVKKSSYILHSGFELKMPQNSTQNVTALKEQPYLCQDQELISWSQSESQERITSVTTVDTPGNFTNLLSRCISWKWRWAAAASQLKTLSKELQNMTISKECKAVGTCLNSQVSANRDKFLTSMKKLGFIHVQNLNNPNCPSKGQNPPAKLKKKEAKFSVSGYKVISIMLSMWRASIKNAKLEQEAVCNGEKLSRLLAGLPWLIQKFEERRHLERMFYHWVLHMLRSKMHIYHTTIHQSGSWSSWHKRPPSSLWVAQLGISDSRIMEGNGYQGRYMRSNHSKPNERHQFPSETRKLSSRSPERNGSATNYQDYVNRNFSAESGDVGLDVSRDESLCFSLKDNRGSLRLSKNMTTAASKASSTGNTLAVPDGNVADDSGWTKESNVTSFTEKAMQTLQISLYNELQKLQELIMSEARLHQEKAREGDEDTIPDESASIGSPFSTSLWRICNGLAHCLIEARNQILALAGNCEPKSSQSTPTTGKSYAKSSNLPGHQTTTYKSSEGSYEKTRSKVLRSESKSKKHTPTSRQLDFQLHQEAAADAEIFEFIGAGKAMRSVAHGDEADACQGAHLPAFVKMSELGFGHGSFSEVKAQQTSVF